MKVVLQKVSKAHVKVDGKIVGRIDKGYCLLVGIHKNSTENDAKYLAKKIASARLFEDEQGKINLSLKEVEGKILSISQFTLYADVKKGNRPSFTNAARPENANLLYDKFNTYLEKEGLGVEKGIFQTHMDVYIENDGPITIIYDSLENNKVK
ncbi:MULTISPECIES: D-aminoacyl-tRNA deacylase [unclassified Gemella]|uniref:D-aminoacyl-tRNA deacylase n=1 Tax=unclassified Gemella TaxID=2624949 RepID=UPI0010744AF1|nr:MULTISPECIES: D-aminoacyl-tRNA deacylase [unclassified Gemella]MBF0709991.1 D-tyrosyl-tRNA(Tyr) deacylase [Gemella sp. GL1.1]MBF0746260.1 D-tyrosyl-tRNA(Tyr) deacylase [Gemella sp. 19428wG2_WT2a]NYS27335.1 D-tyrosyl-tRNA(Tyr) deacylase [Gemella sp. GL1]TFU60539.1 D-tyrosyl-tRNA(Tyr) deacylase [Gemella sp. WT2a]